MSTGTSGDLPNEDMMKMMKTFSTMLEKGMQVSDKERAEHQEATKRSKEEKILSSLTNKKFMITTPDTYQKLLIMRIQSMKMGDDEETMYVVVMKNLTSSDKQTNITGEDVRFTMKQGIIPTLSFRYNNMGKYYLDLMFGANNVIMGSITDSNGTKNSLNGTLAFEIPDDE